MAVRTDRPAPYAPPAAIIEVIKRFRSHGLRTPFDKDVLGRAGIADSLISRTLQALITLELIDESGGPTPILEDLAKAPSDQFQALLGDAVRAAYADVFAFTDPATDMYSKVEDAFRGYSPRGQQSRMVTLFLGLCLEAGIIDAMPTRAKRKRATQPKIAGESPSSGSPKPRRKRFDVDFTKVRVSGINPAITGLIETLPLKWTTAERDAFLVTMEAVLNYAIPVVDEVAEVGDEADDR